MKIIKKGEIPKKKKVVYQFECHNCNTVYQADVNEISIASEKKIGFDMGIYTKLYSISECPLCKARNYEGERMEVEDDA